MTPTLIASVLDPYLRDWLDLLIRWLHVIAAIGWIGSSFYFVLLDQSLRRPKDVADEDAGVRGELWEVHGGGFYHVKKYQVAPPELPDHLAWFKWEAYTTWLSGFSLFVVLYWLDASAYMIDPAVADMGPWTAVGVSASLLVFAWLFYDLACRTIRNDRNLMLVLAGAIAVTAWGTSELFAPRAAWLQTGAMLGTIMAGSVLFNIIPAHWELIRAKEAGREPDPAPGIEAKRRSVHNNYFTLPVLVTMLAGHFTYFVAHDWSWVILLCLMALGAFIRHFYNLRHGGRTQWWMWGVAAAAVAVMFVVLQPEDAPTPAASSSSSSSGTITGGTASDPGRDVFVANCATCHTLADADASGAVGPNLDNARPDATLVRERVNQGKGGMPSFQGRLSDDEVDAVVDYVSTAAGSTDG
ncbi:MAG: urate hydroxylase PuuD [Thermoleophilia bacterium]|nr:urate hydroxylase PuuD [Thermoleophilia bacterium]